MKRWAALQTQRGCFAANTTVEVAGFAGSKLGPQSSGLRSSQMLRKSPWWDKRKKKEKKTVPNLPKRSKTRPTTEQNTKTEANCTSSAAGRLSAAAEQL